MVLPITVEAHGTEKIYILRLNLMKIIYFYFMHPVVYGHTATSNYINNKTIETK
jgi:hypothetical protein